MLGSSLNGLSEKPSVLVSIPEELGDSVRSRHEELWRGAASVGVTEPGEATGA
jgi:hypothetical protein